jgi:hypothetical protein
LLDNGDSTYFLGMGPFNDSGTESSVQMPMPVAGTISDLRVSLSTDPGSSSAPADTYRFTVQKNGVATTLTCDVVANSTTCADDTHTDNTWVAGDLISIHALPVNGPSAEPVANWSLKFQL